MERNLQPDCEAGPITAATGDGGMHRMTIEEAAASSQRMCPVTLVGVLG